MKRSFDIMKKVAYTYLLVAVMALFSFTSTANAVVDLGDLNYGDQATISTTPEFGGIAISQLKAVLPSQSMITFTYNFNADLVAGLLAAAGNYSYGGNDGYALALSSGSLNITENTILAYASADLDLKGNTASATIVNMSEGFLNITSSIIAYLRGNGEYAISYQVTATPIPAALPMFAMGLCAVAAIRRRKKAAA